MSSGRAIDHVGIATRNLDALAAQYEALGFTLTPRAAHPDHMGTSNRLIQLGGLDGGPGKGANFIELIEVDRPETMQPHKAGFMGFGQFNHSFLQKRQGMSLVVFRTDDAAADLARWRSKGLQTYDQFNFERQAKLPDGSEETVRFEIGLVTDPAMPDILFFVCDNKAEQHFWKPEYQQHANGAEEIEAVVLCSAQPAQHADFLSRLFDGDVHEGEGKISVQFGEYDIVVATPAELNWTGWTHNPGPEAMAVGLEIAAGETETEIIKPQDAGGVFIRFT
ncbi:MAG: VOC family protein [Pseudomonadota bacterium]